jgi:hypothetical protein
LAWTPPSKIKLAAIGKNDFGEIESILNPLPCREIAAGSAPQGGTKRRARGKPREFSVICYRLKRESNLKERRLPSRRVTKQRARNRISNIGNARGA